MTCPYQALLEALQAQADALTSGDELRLESLRADIVALVAQVDKAAEQLPGLVPSQRSRRQQLIRRLLEQAAVNRALWEARSAAFQREGESHRAAQRYFSVLGRQSSPASPRFQVEG